MWKLIDHQKFKLLKLFIPLIIKNVELYTYVNVTIVLLQYEGYKDGDWNYKRLQREILILFQAVYGKIGFK